MKNNVFPHPVNSSTSTLTEAALLVKKQLVLLGLLAGVGAFGMVAFPKSTEAPRKVAKFKMPEKIGGWVGRDSKIDPFIYEALRPDSVLQKRFTLVDVPRERALSNDKFAPGAKGTNVEMLVVYTHSPEGFHPPDVCLTMQGWEIVKREQRPITSDKQTLVFDVVTGAQKEQHRQLAYRFTDGSGQVAGRTETFTNMIAARLLRRRVGALEVQFAYDARVLNKDGSFIPEFNQLMVEATDIIHQQLAVNNA